MAKCGRPRKGQEQQSNDRLLDTAAQLFLEHGYGKLSMETIAKEAQVSLRTVYHLHGNKAGLFGALIQRCSDEWLGHLPCEGQLEERLVELATQFLQRITRPEVIRIRAILIGEALSFPELAMQFYAHGPARLLKHLTQFFASQQEKGSLSNQFDAHFLAEQFVSCLRGERYQRLQLGLEQPPDEEAIAAWAKQVTQLFLQGCQQECQFDKAA